MTSPYTTIIIDNIKIFHIDLNIRINTTGEYRKFSSLFPKELKPGFIAYTEQMVIAYINDFISSDYELFDVNQSSTFFINYLKSERAIGDPHKYCEMYILQLILMIKQKSLINSSYYNEQRSKYFDPIISYLESIDHNELTKLCQHLIYKNIKKIDEKRFSVGICRSYDCFAVKNTFGITTYFLNGKKYINLNDLKIDLFWHKATNGRSYVQTQL